MRALVVLPTYNEAATIEDVLRLLRAAAPDVDVLVVDDGSPDGTADLAEKVGEDIAGEDTASRIGGDVGSDIAGGEKARVEVLRRPTKNGLGRAYLAGFAWGLERGYDAMIEMDADLSHDPAVVPHILRALEGADLVIGSRYIPGGAIPQWSRRRRMLSRLGNVYSAWMLGVPVADLTSGFRAFRADLLRRLPLERISAGGYGFQIEMAYLSASLGARVVEVPIRFVDRAEGESKMSWRITVEALRLVTVWGLTRRLTRLARLARLTRRPTNDR